MATYQNGSWKGFGLATDQRRTGNNPYNKSEFVNRIFLIEVQTIGCNIGQHQTVDLILLLMQMAINHGQKIAYSQMEETGHNGL